MDISVIKQKVDYCYKALSIFISGNKNYHNMLECMGFIESVTNTYTKQQLFNNWRDLCRLTANFNHSNGIKTLSISLWCVQIFLLYVCIRRVCVCSHRLYLVEKPDRECMTCALLVLTCICVSAISNTHMMPGARTSSLPLFHRLFLPLCAGFYCMPLLFKLFLPPFSSIPYF